MAVQRSDLTEQEQSIRARGHEVFNVSDQAIHNYRPFRDYLKETPSAPLSGSIKAILWAIAVVVGLLFVASLFTIHRGPVKKNAGEQPSAATPPGTAS